MSGIQIKTDLKHPGAGGGLIHCSPEKVGLQSPVASPSYPPVGEQGLHARGAVLGERLIHHNI